MMLPCLVVLGAAAVLVVAFDAPLAALVPLLACPVMMFVMMRTMGGMGGSPEDPATRGRDHEPVHDEERPPTPHR